MAWVTILAAGLFETGFAVSLKLSHGMTKLGPTVSFALCALLSFALLTIALRQLEVGTAYAVWTGIGAVGAAIVGMIACQASSQINIAIRPKRVSKVCSRRPRDRKRPSSKTP